MFETFVIEKFSKNNNNNNDYTSINLNTSNYIALLVGFIISLLAAYLAFNCNIKENAATRWVVTVFAFLFPLIYSVYYFIAHVLLGYKCYPKKK